MSELTDEILSQVDIVDVVGKYVQLKRSGVNFSGLCPFHNEKTPSFIVSPQKQIFKCFGCGQGGNVISFVKEIERTDFRDAVKTLAKEGNIDIKKYENKKFSVDTYTDEKEKIKKIHKEAQSFFIESLHKSDVADKYLETERKLDKDIIKTFGIGFAPDSYPELIQALRKRGFSDEEIEQASLSREKSGDSYAFFRNRITFPIYDAMNNVVAFSARIIDPKDKPKYLNSSEHKAFVKSKILYGLHIAKNYIKEYKSLIVVEGQMDVIALYRLGFPIGVATCGTSLTIEHIRLLKRHTENVYLLFDNDKAGKQAVIRAIKVAYQQNIFPKMITLSENFKDVDDLANTVDGKKKFKQAQEEAPDTLTYIIQSMSSKTDLQSPVDKQKFLYQIFAIILNIDNVSIQDHYLQILSERSNIAYPILVTQFKKFIKTDGKFEMRNLQNANKEKSRYKLDREKVFLALFYQEFINTYTQTPNIWKKFNTLINELAMRKKDSILASIFLEKKRLLDDVNQELMQLQLWREEQLLPLDELGKYNLVKNVCTPMIKQYLKEILHNKNITPDDKHNLLNLRKKI